MLKCTPVLILLLAFALTAATYGGGGLEKPISDEQFVQKAGDFTTAIRTTDNAVPIFAVRNDDGVETLYTHNIYRAFLEQGIPLSLAINEITIDSTGFLTTAMVQSIIASYDSAGVAIEIVNHFNDALQGDPTIGYAQLVYEMLPGPLETLTGKSVKVIAQMGDHTTYARRNRGIMKAIADSLGYKYWDASTGTGDQVRKLKWWPHEKLSITDNPIYDLTSGGIFPGCSLDPLEMPQARSVDFGQYKIERAAKVSGSGQYSGFTILADGSGTPTLNGDWNDTFRFAIEASLANGQGLVLATHDSTKSPETVGDFSYYRMAEVLAAYRDAGFLRLGTCSDVYEWGMSRWAPGTDIANNIAVEVPSYAIGDTVGVQYGWIAGWGSYRVASTNWPNQQSAVWPAGINAQFDNTNAGYPGWSTGTQVVGYQGRGGALRQDVNNGFLNFIRADLPEGRYEFRLFSSHTTVKFKQMSLAVSGKYMRMRNSLENVEGAYGDTTLVLWDDDTDASIVMEGAQDASMTIPFTIDGTDAAHRLAWTQDADHAAGYVDPYWLNNWAGGVHFQIEWSGAANHAYIQLIYLGPLE